MLKVESVLLKGATMKKLKFLAVIMTIIMTVTMFPLTASAATLAQVSQGLVYTDETYSNYLTGDAEDNTYTLIFKQTRTVNVSLVSGSLTTYIWMRNSKGTFIKPTSVRSSSGKLSITDHGAFAGKTEKTKPAGTVSYTLLPGTYYLQFFAHEDHAASATIISFAVATS